MHILYISFYFAPFNNIAAVRGSKLCKYLFRMGHDVRVISASDQLLPKDLNLEIPKEKVIYSQWKNINNPLKFFFKEKEKVAQNRSYLTKEQKKNSFVKGVVKLYKSFFYFPDDKLGWIRPAFKDTKLLFKEWKPDVIYVSGGPFSAFILGSILYKKYNIPWIAEYRDLWTQGHQYKGGKFRKNIEKPLEGWATSSAKCFVTVSDPLAEQLENRFNRKVHVINNAFDQEDRIHLSASLSNFKKDKLNIIYTGQIYIDRQDLSSLFEALQKNEVLRNNIIIHFYGPNLKEKIEKKFDEKLLKKIGANLFFHGLVSHKKAMNAQESADLLLLLGWTDEDFKGVLTGKLFEYLGARKKILSLNHFLDDASQLVVDSNAGYFCKCANEVSVRLEELIKIKKQNDTLPSDTNSLKKFSYKSRSLQLIDIFEQIESGTSL